MDLSAWPIMTWNHTRLPQHCPGKPDFHDKETTADNWNEMYRKHLFVTQS